MQQRIKSAAENMIAMDTSIYNLFKEGVIDRHTAVAEAVNPEIMAQRLTSNSTTFPNTSYAASSNLHVRSNVAFYFTQDSL